MKNLIKITTVFALIISVNTNAQETDVLNNREVSEFTELQSQVNTEVIIIKSTRNNILIQGSEEAQKDLLIQEQEGRLAISFQSETIENQLTRIVIETTGFNSLISGGIGNYFVIGLDQKNFVLMNPAAKVSLSGTLDNIYLTSLSGHTDLSKLSTENEWVELSETASYVESKFSGRNLIAKKAE
ncbi:MAG: hypothetical protein ACMZ7B_08605 [Balneola sp.]